MRISFILIFLFATIRLNAQDLKGKIKTIEVANQECLDNGKLMLNCSNKYYSEIDSLLNEVYIDIQYHMTKKEKQDLKVNQFQWLKLRDKKFIKIGNKESGFSKGCNDDLMIKKQAKTEFVIMRIKYLLFKHKAQFTK